VESRVVPTRALNAIGRAIQRAASALERLKVDALEFQDLPPRLRIEIMTLKETVDDYVPEGETNA